MTPVSLSANCFEYYSTLFYVIPRMEFPWHYLCGAAFRMTRSDIRAAVDVVRKNNWTGCTRNLTVLNEPYFLLFVF